MMADVREKVSEAWRAITDEQDSPRRWVLRARLLFVCCVLSLAVLLLLNKLLAQLDPDLLSLVWWFVGLLLYALVSVCLCRSVAVLVSRAQYRLRSQCVPAGPLRAAVWCFVKGDASIRVACLLTVLGLATLWAGDWALLREPNSQVLFLSWFICNLFTAGALPKDRFFVGPPPPVSTERKIVWMVVGVISGLILTGGFLNVQHCGCSHPEAIALMIQPLFASVAVFGICLIVMNHFDPLARRRLNYGRR